MFDSVRNQLPEHLVPHHLRRKYLAASVTRRRLIRNAVSITIASCVGIGVSTVVDRARTAERSWGTTRAVVMTTGVVAAGDLVGADSVRIEMIPLAIVPDEAIMVEVDPAATQRAAPDADAVIGRRTSTRLGPGEIITVPDLVDSGSGQIGAALDEHESAVSLKLPSGHPGLEVHDRVDVYGSTTDQRMGRLAAGARVLAVEDRYVTLSLPDSDVVSVLSAAEYGHVSLVITG